MEASLNKRSHWGSRIGFILAAAGSAVGLGNIWKFPYVTGENGGGIFVLIYLGCVILVGLPVMIAEILIGRSTQNSPVGAFKSLAGPRSPWVGMGWLSVLSAFVLLSFYSVVAGWSLHYAWLSISDQLAGLGPDNVAPVFGSLHASAGANLFWHLIFMGLTIAVVYGGVSKGVERWSRILMPALLIMMLVLLINSLTLDGFGKAFQFLFGFHQDKFTAGGALEALGQAFFSLSLGMGAMLTYGSYLRRRDDVVGASVTISALDTCIALVASLMLFPIIFSYGMEPAAGPGRGRSGGRGGVWDPGHHPLLPGAARPGHRLEWGDADGLSVDPEHIRDGQPVRPTPGDPGRQRLHCSGPRGRRLRKQVRGR